MDLKMIVQNRFTHGKQPNGSPQGITTPVLPELPPLYPFFILAIGMILICLVLTTLGLYLVTIKSRTEQCSNDPDGPFIIPNTRGYSNSLLDETERELIENDLERQESLSSRRVRNLSYDIWRMRPASDLSKYADCRHGRRICYVCNPCHSDRCSAFSECTSFNSSHPSSSESENNHSHPTNRISTRESVYPYTVSASVQAYERGAGRLDNQDGVTTKRKRTLTEKIETMMERCMEFLGSRMYSSSRERNPRGQYEILVNEDMT